MLFFFLFFLFLLLISSWKPSSESGFVSLGSCLLLSKLWFEGLLLSVARFALAAVVSAFTSPGEIEGLGEDFGFWNIVVPGLAPCSSQGGLEQPYLPPRCCSFCSIVGPCVDSLAAATSMGFVALIRRTTFFEWSSSLVQV